MKRADTNTWNPILPAFLLLVLVSSGAFAAEAPPAGEITLLTGRATAATDEGTIRSLERGGTVYSGEVISTAPNSYVNMKFRDGGRVLLRPNSRFEIEQFQYDEKRRARQAAEQEPDRERDRRQAQADTEPAEEEEEDEENAVFRLLKGGFRAVTGLIGREKKDDYKVRTPVATIGIRGTDFEARLCEGNCQDIDPKPQNGLYVGVQDGGISITNDTGTVNRDAGQYAFVAGQNVVPQLLPTRPPALAQDPMPDPATCGE